MLSPGKNKTSIYIAIMLLICVSFSPYLAKANSSNECEVFYLNDHHSITGTLFGDEETIYPGKTIKKEFYIANNKSFDCYLNGIDISGKLYSIDNKPLNRNDCRYKRYLSSAEVSFLCEDNLIFSGTIEDFLSDSSVIAYQSVIKRNRKKKFSIEYSLDREADSSTMELKHKFDISFRFSQMIDNDNGSGNTGGNSGNNGNNSGGVGNGGGTGNNGGGTGSNGGNNSGGNGGSAGGSGTNNSNNQMGGAGGSGSNNNGSHVGSISGIAGSVTDGDTKTGDNNGSSVKGNDKGTEVENNGTKINAEESQSNKPEETVTSEINGAGISIATDKKVGEISLVKTGYFVDTKILLAIGTFLCIIGCKTLSKKHRKK
jgi:hypothetical protein